MSQSDQLGPLTRAQWAVVGGFGLAVVGIHLVGLEHWGFHRDEFLYLAQGRRLAWGYWSTPPLVGFLAWSLQQFTDASLVAVRLVPALAGALTMAIVALIARDMGGGTRAVALSCLPFLLSPGLLRTAGLFQPVVFDVLFWTLGMWVVVRFLKSERPEWLLALGVVVGIGLLNKYSIGVFVAGLVAAALLTRHRRALQSPFFWSAIAAALLIASPNIAWQFSHGTPVLAHVRELADTQLVNVRRSDFLVDQLIIHLPVGMVWLGGLVWLVMKRGRQFLFVGLVFAAVLSLLFLLRGKSYYTLGAYPVLFAAGAVWLEQLPGRIVRPLVVATALLLGILASPLSITYLSVQGMLEYDRKIVDVTGMVGPLRWETGIVHDLPQDYADMLGWQELADLAIAARMEGDTRTMFVYAENYGQAGAIEYYGAKAGLGVVASFADSYRLWAPDSLPANMQQFVYVNTGLDPDVAAVFEETRLIGRVTNPHARESGAGVYVLSRPDSAAWTLYANVADAVKSSFRGER